MLFDKRICSSVLLPAVHSTWDTGAERSSSVPYPIPYQQYSKWPVTITIPYHTVPHSGDFLLDHAPVPLAPRQCFSAVAGCFVQKPKLRGGESIVDWDTVASNRSTGNCLSNFSKRISSKSSNWTIWAPASSPLPRNPGLGLQGSNRPVHCGNNLS